MPLFIIIGASKPINLSNQARVNFPHASPSAVEMASEVGQIDLPTRLADGFLFSSSLSRALDLKSIVTEFLKRER
jgi:hypothetical protein